MLCRNLAQNVLRLTSTSGTNLISKLSEIKKQTISMSKIHQMHCVSTVEITDVTLHINLPLFLLAASVILERIIRTLVDKKLLTIERLEMLTTSKLRTFRFSWLDNKQLLVKGKKKKYETKITDILQRTSIICPVTIFEC